MRRPVFLAVALLGAAAVVGAAPAVATKAPLSVRLSNTHAGATRVALRLSFPTALRCGVPVGSIVASLPRSAHVPRRIDASTVGVDGRPPLEVTVKGTAITVLSGRSGTTCDSIVDGNAVVTIGAAAGLGNPSRPGAYAVRVAHGGELYGATIAIVRK